MVEVLAFWSWFYLNAALVGLKTFIFGLIMANLEAYCHW